MVAYHAMMARLHLTFAKQQALLSSMATPPAPHTEAQREPMVVSACLAAAPPDIAMCYMICERCSLRCAHRASQWRHASVTLTPCCTFSAAIVTACRASFPVGSNAAHPSRRRPNVQELC